jgi:hypothetical protein
MPPAARGLFLKKLPVKHLDREASAKTFDYLLFLIAAFSASLSPSKKMY